MTTINRSIWRNGPHGSHIVALIEYREDDPRGLSDGFSVTGELYERHGTWDGAAQKRNGREWDSGGCIHEVILSAFPGLKPLVDLHLSGADGAPMHAEANGWYWYSSYDGKGTHGVRDGRTDYQVACDHLRVADGAIPTGLTREEFSAFVDAQRERWAKEAEHGRELIASLPTVEELRSYETFGNSIGANPPLPAEAAWVNYAPSTEEEGR